MTTSAASGKEVEVKVRVGHNFLTVSCGGQEGLTTHIDTCCPGKEFTFSISYHTEISDEGNDDDSDSTDTTAAAREGDSSSSGSGEDDDEVDLVTIVRLQATRCGRLYNLCATRDHHTHPYTPRVSFQPAGMGVGEKGVEEGCRWVLSPLPGPRFVLESCLFPDYCLASDDDRLELRRVSRARRCRQVALYPVHPALHPARTCHYDRRSSSSPQPLSGSRSSESGSSVVATKIFSVWQYLRAVRL